MSGTSMDGIDAVVVDFNLDKRSATPAFRILGHHHINFDRHYQDKAQNVIEHQSLIHAYELGHILAQHYVNAVHTTLEKLRLTAQNIEFCAVSGHTLFHRPPTDKGNGMTIDTTDLSMLAALTDITTIGKFRQKDIAFGGQGAPLVPFAHPFIFGKDHPNALIQNMGGMGNLTLLEHGHPVAGWDTGPGNTWIDQAMQWHTNGMQRFDEDGQTAARGKADLNLLDQLLDHAFFRQPPPKSTGLQTIGLPHIGLFRSHILALSKEDALATVTHATAKTISNAYEQWILPNHHPNKIILCGGGAKNKTLIRELKTLCAPLEVISSQKIGIDPCVVEALSFAFLGLYRYLEKPNTLAHITGAFKDSIGGEMAIA